jgi:hypothetical protein
MPNRRPRLSVDTVNPQLTENRIAMSSSDRNTRLIQILTNFPNTPRRLIQVDVVDKLHKIQLVLTYRLRLTVNRRTVYLQRLALLDQWEIMFTVDHLFALSNPALMSALSKKSFYKVSLPIFASIFSMLGAGVPSAFSPKASLLRSRSCAFQAVTWLG